MVAHTGCGKTARGHARSVEALRPWRANRSQVFAVCLLARLGAPRSRPPVVRHATGASRRNDSGCSSARTRAVSAALDARRRSPRQYKFTNAYRASDRVSQYLIRRVIYRDDLPNDPAEVVFRILLFKLFNKIETWELLEKAVGPVTLRRILVQAVRPGARRGRWTRGQTIYSAAYIMPSGGLAGARAEAPEPPDPDRADDGGRACPPGWPRPRRCRRRST